MNLWYKKYVNASPLQHADWDSFRDPDQITYRGYNTMQDGQEQFVDQLLEYEDLHARVKAMTATDLMPQMALRIGYAPPLERVRSSTNG